jgi:hypothetical protein
LGAKRIVLFTTRERMSIDARAAVKPSAVAALSGIHSLFR